MRTSFGSSCFVIVAAAWVGTTIGCSNLDAGRVGDPAGAPRLIKALVQDSSFVGGPPDQRGGIVDLLDDQPPPSCSDTNPCSNQFLIAQITPPLECSDPAGGVCVDPLKVPQTGVPLNPGGNNIRLVFDRLLGADIESVMVDGNGAPTPGKPYALKPGIVELIGPDGMPVAGATAYWDNSGSPLYTSDVILLPFGPAIVVNPGSLLPSSNYIVRLHPAQLKDRKGQGVSNAGGAALSDPTDIPFTTEGITTNPDLSFPDFSTAPTTIAPNQILQLAFWENLDESTVMVSGSGPAGFVVANVEGYADRGDDPAKCTDGENDTLLDFVYTGGGAARMPVDWPAGSYTLTFTVKDASGHATFTSPSLAFTVAGAAVDPAHDANAAAKHVTPEQCQ